MHALDVLGDPVRRQILELLARGEQSAGEIAGMVGDRFGISQAASSQHLKVLRDHGFAVVRKEGARRIYALDVGPMREIDRWLGQFRAHWEGAAKERRSRTAPPAGQADLFDMSLSAGATDSR